MLRFTFDNDAIEHLVRSDTFEEHRQEIQRASNRQDLMMHLSRTNVLEIVKGVTERNFRRLQMLLRQAYAFGGRRNLLLSPSHHLKWGLGRVDPHTLNEWYNSFYNDVFQLFKAANYPEFQERYAKVSASLDRGNDAIWNNAKDVKQAILAKLDSKAKKKSADWFLSPEGSSLFFDLMYSTVLQQFNLGDDVIGLEREEVVRRLPSLVQFCDTFRTLQRKRIIEGHNPQKGDYFDIQKVVYLDLCDYIVSDDRRFRALVDAAGTSDLFGRAIPLSKFLQHIHRPFLLNRSIGPGHESAEVDRLKRLYEY